MENIVRVLSKEIASALLGLVPGGRILFKVTEKNIDSAVDKIYDKEKSHPVKEIADQISESILSSPSVDRSNPGAALAACRDIESSIAKSGISYEQLIEMEFDAKEVSERILLQKFYDFEFSSSQRRALWEQGVRKFSEVLCQTIPQLPEITPLMLVHIIRTQNIILSKLDNFTATPPASDTSPDSHE